MTNNEFYSKTYLNYLKTLVDQIARHVNIKFPFNCINVYKFCELRNKSIINIVIHVQITIPRHSETLKLAKEVKHVNFQQRSDTFCFSSSVRHENVIFQRIFLFKYLTFENWDYKGIILNYFDQWLFIRQKHAC